MEENKIFNNKVVFDFNACCLYEANNEGNRVSLTTPSRDCLAIITLNSPNTTSQQVLFEQVWEQHGIPVNVNTLYQHISMIRRAFRQLGMNDDVIVTIPRRGMCLAAGLHVAALAGGKQVPCIERLGQPGRVIEKAPDIILQPAAEVDNQQYPEKAPADARGPSIINWLLIALLTLSVALIATVLMAYFFSTKNGRFHDYHHAMKVNGCDIYLYKKEIAWSRDKISDALAEAGKTCSQSERVYISYFNTLPRVSLISCNGDILRENTDCSSYYIYREGGHRYEK